MANDAGVDLSLEKLTFDLNQATPLKAARSKKRTSRSAHKPRRKPAPRQEFQIPALQNVLSSKSGLSLLESLPFDILERIFLESGNPHLLRAAPIIGATLSNNHTYNEFCRRFFCLPVRGGPANAIGPPMTPPKSPATAAERQKQLERERRTNAHYRSVALQSRWATYDFFSAFDDSISQSKDLWFGSFSCEIPTKLLKWPMSKSGRKFFFALATAGAGTDPKGLSGEMATDIWHGAMHACDAAVMVCLVERHIGRPPSRDERLEALKANDHSLELLRTFKYLRTLRERRHCAVNGLRTNRFPDDWSDQWPLHDPETCALVLEKHNISRERLEEELTVNGSHSGKTWRRRFSATQR